jgi:hypothetical protein
MNILLTLLMREREIWREGGREITLYDAVYFLGVEKNNFCNFKIMHQTMNNPSTIGAKYKENSSL